MKVLSLVASGVPAPQFPHMLQEVFLHHSTLYCTSHSSSSLLTAVKGLAQGWKEILQLEFYYRHKSSAKSRQLALGWKLKECH